MTLAETYIVQEFVFLLDILKCQHFQRLVLLYFILIFWNLRTKFSSFKCRSVHAAHERILKQSEGNMALTIIIILTNTVFTCPVWSTVNHESLITMYCFQYKLFWCVGGWSEIFLINWVFFKKNGFSFVWICC